MSAAMRSMAITRWVILSVLLAFSFSVLVVNAYYTWTIMNTVLDDGFIQLWPVATPDSFGVFNIAVAGLTIVTVVPIIIIDVCRVGAFTSWIVVELSCLGLLDVLWLAAGAWTSSLYSDSASTCAANTSVSNLNATCACTQASLAFSWLNWIMLFAYCVTLLTLACMSQSKGKPIWKSSVRLAGVSKAPSATQAYSATASIKTPGNGQYTPMPPVQVQVPIQGQPAMQAYGQPLYPPQPSGYPYGGGAVAQV